MLACASKRTPHPIPGVSTPGNKGNEEFCPAPLRISCGKKLLTRLGESRVFDPADCRIRKGKRVWTSRSARQHRCNSGHRLLLPYQSRVRRPAAKFHGGKRVSDESKQAPERKQRSSATARGFRYAHAPWRVLWRRRPARKQFRAGP